MTYVWQNISTKNRTMSQWYLVACLVEKIEGLTVMKVKGEGPWVGLKGSIFLLAAEKGNLGCSIPNRGSGSGMRCSVGIRGCFT